MAKTRTQRNAQRAVAGLRRAGRIGTTTAFNAGGRVRATGGPLAAGGERGATRGEMRNLRRTTSRSFQKRQGIGLSGGNSH